MAKLRKFIEKGKFRQKSNEKQKTAWQSIKKVPGKETFLFLFKCILPTRDTDSGSPLMQCRTLSFLEHFV